MRRCPLTPALSPSEHGHLVKHRMQAGSLRYSAARRTRNRSSAGFQPAVSPISNRQACEGSAGRWDFSGVGRLEALRSSRLEICATLLPSHAQHIRPLGGGEGEASAAGFCAHARRSAVPPTHEAQGRARHSVRAVRTVGGKPRRARSDAPYHRPRFRGTIREPWRLMESLPSRSKPERLGRAACRRAGRG